MADPKLTIKGDSSGAVIAVRRLKTELGELQTIAAKSFAFGGLLTGGAAVTGLVAITKNAIDAGDALNKMSQKTGFTVEELSKLGYAAGLSGVSNEVLQKSLTSLAVTMVEAKDATSPAAKSFEKLGISVRDTDGRVKSSLSVLYELADRFAAMPDGVEKTNLAVDIFGRKLGADLIPLLNTGSEGLKAMGDEAEQLGIVMSSELAKQSEEFNDNLERLTKLSESAGISIANSLIPSLNKVLVELLNVNKAGVGFWESGYLLARYGRQASESMDAYIGRIRSKLDELKKYREKATEETAKNVNLDGQIAQLERWVKYLELQQKSESGDGVSSAQELAAKRIGIERQMQAKMAELANLRSVAEGKASAEILDSDAKRTAQQIKNAEAVRDALTAAWRQSLSEAQAAGQAAQKLFDQAADVRTSASDRAAAKRRSGSSTEDQQAQIRSQYDTLASAAEQAANLALVASLNGRTENAAKLAKQAERDAERAAKLADQIDDPEAGARAIEEVAAIQARLLESQARAKSLEQKQLQERAIDQYEQMMELNKQLDELKAKAAGIKVQADIEEAQGAIATLQAQLDNLKDKTITVTVNQVGNVPANADTTIPAQPGGGYARGGWTGAGHKYKVAGVVHAGEVVQRSEVVRQPGALPFLLRFNEIGMGAIREYMARMPGYAAGGLVSNLRIPSVESIAPAPAKAGASAVFNFPGMGSFPVQMQPDVLGELQGAFSREALKRGGRRK